MNYFRQSLISIPTYIPPPSYRDTISLYSIDDILNEPVSPKDRRDLNKIYEQADIFVKRNSIVTINNKKQKKLISSTLNNPNQTIVKPIKQQGHVHQLQQIIGRQNAFFQQIHPADVQKNNEDNIFDYRLHMKLARGQEIFKVDQVKRKIKKRNISGKECQCCAKQVMKNHRCQHTLCDQKCGKIVAKSEKINENSKKQHSSLWSESKQQNWEEENADGQNKDKQKDKDGNTKVGNLSGSIKNINQKQKNDKPQKQKRSSSKLNRGQSSSSNKESNNNGQPSQYLLASIQKLLMSEMNNFTYKVIQIKQYEQNEQQMQDEQLDNKGDMQQDDDKDMMDGQQLSQQQDDDNKYDMDERGYSNMNNKQIKNINNNTRQLMQRQMNVNRFRIGMMNNKDNEQLLKNKQINNIQQVNNNKRQQNDNKQQNKQDKMNVIQQNKERKTNTSRVIQYNLKLVHLDIESSTCKMPNQLSNKINNYNKDENNYSNNYYNNEINYYKDDLNKQNSMISQQQQQKIKKQSLNKQINHEGNSNKLDIQQNNNQIDIQQVNNNKINIQQVDNQVDMQQNDNNQKQQKQNKQKKQNTNKSNNNLNITKQQYKKISIIKNVSVQPLIPSSQSSSQSIIQSNNNNHKSHIYQLQQSISNHNNNSKSQFQSINQNNIININRDQNIINSSNIQSNTNKNIQSNQQDNSSIPDFQSQNSLDQQIDEIIQQQINTLSQNHKIKINNKLNSTILKSTTPQKLTKKQSKKIKMIQKQRLLSENIQEIDSISDGQLQLNQDQQNISNNHQQGLGKGKGKGRGMGRGKGIFQQELDIYQQNSQILASQKQQEIIQNKSNSNVKYSPNKNSLLQPILPNSQSPVQHPSTPRRHIPNISKIIQQIRFETQNNSYEKGLGRGKIFGRGLGILQQAQYLQKQIEQEGIIFDQQQGFGKASKKIKIKIQKQQQQSSVLNQDGDQQIVDKFDQLIQEQIQQGNIVALNNLQASRSMDDRSQARYLKRYLQKRQSVIDNLDCGKYELSEQQQEKNQIKQLEQKQQGEMDINEMNDQVDQIQQGDDKQLLQDEQNMIQVNQNDQVVDVMNGQQQLESMMNLQMKGDKQQYQ